MATTLEKNCGTGSGGFKPGNSCGSGGSSGGGSSGGSSSSGGSGGSGGSSGTTSGSDSKKKASPATDSEIAAATLKIAKKHDLVSKHGDLKTRNNDSDDFYEVFNKDVGAGLAESYNAGRKHVGGRKVKAPKATMSRIAEDNLGVESFEVRKSDSLDFSEVSTAGMRKALSLAWKNGENDAIRAAKRKKKNMTIFGKNLVGRSDSYGLMTAGHFTSGVAGCFAGVDGAMCPAEIVGMEQKAFDLMVKESFDRPVYVEKETQIVIAEGDLMTKAKELAGDSRAEVLSKALAVFENVMSVSGEDRDGDLMHTMGKGNFKGMVLDDNMPLLWMHMQVNPLGVFLGKSQHDASILKGLFAIAATKLGEDAVTLCELGALRTSIGFNPHEGAVTPRKTATVGGRKKVLSWEIKGCDVMEDSLVSVPSCKDAVITAFSRKSLKDELVSKWAKGLYDGRPLIVPGADVEDASETDVDSTKGKMGGKCDCKDKAKCECGKKPKKGGKGDAKGDAENTNNGDTDDNADPNEKLYERLVTKGFTDAQAKQFTPEQAELLLDHDVAITPHVEELSLTVKSFADSLSHKLYGMNDHFLPGSYEWLCYRIDSMSKSFLVGQGVMQADDYGAGLVATFDSEVILCCGPYNQKRCYRVAYSVGDDGVPRFSGEAIEVEIKAQVVEKWFGLMQKRIRLFLPEEQEDTAIDLARKLCAMTVDSDDETLGEALRMTAHASNVFESHDEQLIYGDLLASAD